MFNAYRKTSPGTGQSWRVKPACDAFAIECGRHDDQAQVRPQGGLHITRQCGAKVAVQMALVEFVEQDRADTGQFRIVLQQAGKDALGDHFDARGCRDFRFVPNPVAHRFANPLATC